MTLLLICAFLFLASDASLAPDTRLGRQLRQALILAPAGWLSEATPKKVAISLIVTAVLVALIFTAPQLVAIIGVGDMAIMLDLTIVALLASAGERIQLTIKQAGAFLRDAVGGRPVRGATSGRPPRSRRQRAKGAHGDDPAPGRRTPFNPALA